MHHKPTMYFERFMPAAASSALVVVDIQERLAAVMEAREKVTANVGRLIALAGLMSIPVIVTEQYPKGLGPTIEEIRKVVPGFSPIEKITFDCCGEPRFNEEVRKTGRKHIILTGMETHICVLQTCLGLLADNRFVHVPEDAVCSRTGENRQTGIAFMRNAGAVITSTETVLFQILRQAGTEEFRAISKLIK